MRSLSQSASIWQLLTIAYLVVTVPAIVFVKFTCNALDYRIGQAQFSESDGDKFAFDTNPRSAWFIQIGQTIRKHNAPFSISPNLNLESDNNRQVALSLSDIRTAMIYIWGTIFIIGGIAIWRLGVLLNRPLGKLTKSIARLTRNELVESVGISGPRNIEEMGQGLEKLRRRLKESEKQQTLFLRHISHEIKTPLTSIKEGSKLLDDQLLGPINEEQHEVAGILVKSSNELQVAIENLLNYSSAIALSKQKQHTKLDLAELVLQALDKHEISIRKKGLVLEKELNAGYVYANQTQILTVFENLISNAVKHSPNNGTLSLTLKFLKNEVAEFIIRDEGPGVNSSQRHAIFDAFFVGDQSEKTTLKGTGLGLSIAKQYIDAHEGIIQLLNTRKGAAFRVVLG